MPALGVTIDITGYAEQVSDARGKDIPFVTAVALTRTAQDGQIEVRREMAQKFTLRNTWTQEGVRITPAKKSDYPLAFSEVYTDTSNTSTGAPDYLLPQEVGGEKVPFAGGHIAIPTRYLRAISPGPIPDPLRPRNLLPADAQLRRVYGGRFDGPTTGGRFRQLSGRQRTALGTREFVAFLRYDQAGTLCIFVRAGNSRDPIPYYVLVTEARIRPVLQMQQTVERVAGERFEQHWDDAWNAIT